jgi:hypothetical protein
VGTLTNNLVDIGYYEGVVDAFGIGLSKYYDTETGTLLLPRSQVSVKENKFTYTRVKVTEFFSLKDAKILKPVLNFLKVLLEKVDCSSISSLANIAGTLLIIINTEVDEGLLPSLAAVTELVKIHDIKLLSTYRMLEERSVQFPLAVSRLCQSLAAISLNLAGNDERIAFYREKIMEDFTLAGHLATSLDIKVPVTAKKNSGIVVGPQMTPIVIKTVNELAPTDHILLSSKVAGAAIKTYFTNPSQHNVYVIPASNSVLYTSNKDQKVKVNTKMVLNNHNMFISSAEHYVPLQPIVKESARTVEPKGTGAVKTVSFANI